MNKIILLIIFSVIFSIHSAKSQQDPSTLLAEGIRSVEAEDYSDAINFLTQYLASYPNDAQASYNRAVAYYYLQNYNDALSDANTAITADMNYKQAYVIRGMARTALQDYGGAVTDFTFAINIDPSYNDAYYYRAAVYIDEKDYPEAISDLNDVITNDPQYMKAYMKRGEAYLLSGDYKSALTSYNTFLASQPDAKAYFDRGISNYNLHNYDDAVSDFQNAMKLDPSLSNEANELISKAQKNLNN